MRALFYNHTGRASGAERVLILALRHLDRSVVDPSVVCPNGELADAVKNLGLPVSHIGELNARITLWPHKLVFYAVSLIRTVWALRSEVRRTRSEIVHANSPRSGVAAIFATAGMSLPVVLHVHDEFAPHPITSLIRFLARICSRCKVIAVSEATAASFAGGSAKLKRRVRVIHNAVDITAIDDESSSRKVRDELGLNQEDFLFGIVGQITPRKGQLELVKALGRVAADMPLAKLLVIGAPIFNNDSVYQQNVLQLTASLGLTDRVLFLGQRADAINIIKQLDALIINSKSEAFVMVGIEAMACRTPIVATDVGGTREMIDDGHHGLLIPSGDEAALDAALAKIYGHKDLRELFAARARERVEKEFNIARFAGEFHSALVTAVPGTAPSTASITRPFNAIENQ